MAQWKQIRLGTMRLHVHSLASLNGLRIQGCRDLWYRLWMWLGSGIAAAVVWASSYSSDLTPSLGNSICHGCGSKMTTKKKKKKNLNQIFKEEIIPILHKILEETENEGTFSQLFYEVSKTMILKPKKDITRKTVTAYITYDHRYKKPLGRY